MVAEFKSGKWRLITAVQGIKLVQVSGTKKKKENI
jgi:hypothetical protein